MTTSRFLPAGNVEPYTARVKNDGTTAVLTSASALFFRKMRRVIGIVNLLSPLELRRPQDQTFEHAFSLRALVVRDIGQNLRVAKLFLDHIAGLV